MKHLLIFFAVLSTVAFSCSPAIQKAIEDSLNPLSYKVEEAINAWSAEKANLTLDREKDGTWLDVGIRYKYAVLKKYVNIKALQEVTGEAVFISGPHQNGINYNSENDFGHYNPAFLAKVKEGLNAGMTRSVFNNIAQEFYDSKLKSMARTYYRAYRFVKKKGGKGAFSVKNETDQFRGYADSEERLGYDWYEAETAPSFWVRRFEDGTAETFFEILNIVLDKYDTEFQKD